MSITFKNKHLAAHFEKIYPARAGLRVPWMSSFHFNQWIEELMKIIEGEFVERKEAEALYEDEKNSPGQKNNPR